MTISENAAQSSPGLAFARDWQYDRAVAAAADTIAFWKSAGFRVHLTRTTFEWVVFNIVAAEAVQYGMSSIFAGPFDRLEDADAHLRSLGLHLLAP